METFGRYQLVQKLGLGGMAEIFLARSASLDGFEKELVIKRIRPELGSEAKFFSMFIDEARISISLSHPNIVQVFDFGEVHGTYYLAMEYVRGCDLAKLFLQQARKGKGLDPAIALLIIGELLKGLDYAHNRKTREGEPLNVVHRDVSPQNIMLSFDGNVKLTDFGIARARGRASETTPGMVLGKLAYMSPEQLRGEELDRRVDVFACGVVLWEMLVGASLFGAQVRSGAYDRIIQAIIDPPSSRRPELPPELDALVLRAVARDPAQRYQSARDFGSAVHSYLVQHHPEANIYALQSFLEAQEREMAQAPQTLARPPGTPTLIMPKPEDAPHAAAVPAPAPAVAPAPAPAVVPTPAAVAPPPLPIPVPPLPMAADATPVDSPVDSDVPQVMGTQDVLRDEPDTFEWSPALIKVIEAFHRRPSLWHLVKMGEICAAEGQNAAAQASFRVAAVKFAQRGLLAQAVLCSKHMLERGRDQQAVEGELATFPRLIGRSDAEVAPFLFRTSGPVEDLLAELLAEAKPVQGDVGSPTPLIAHLDGKTFAELVATAPMRRFEEGEKIVEQGQAGRTMHLIARGRVLVYATPPKHHRIYLSSLTAGDFFGENGFFTGAPRSATVEALYPVDALEIDRALYSRLTLGNPEANGILLHFYKERIVETVMAKSPVFGLLGSEDRRAIVAKFTPRVFKPGELVIREGASSDQIYLVKDGEAEVFIERDGVHTTLSSLGAGTIFGEIAALRNIPRTASVAARGKLEVLELGGADFLRVLEAQPELRRRVFEVVTQRARDNMDKLVTPVEISGPR